jgi:hypothetical protein
VSPTSGFYSRFQISSANEPPPPVLVQSSKHRGMRTASSQQGRRRPPAAVQTDGDPPSAARLGGQGAAINHLVLRGIQRCRFFNFGRRYCYCGPFVVTIYHCSSRAALGCRDVPKTVVKTCYVLQSSRCASTDKREAVRTPCLAAAAAAAAAASDAAHHQCQAAAAAVAAD